MKGLIECVRTDMVMIHDEWHNAELDSRLIMPDTTQSSFSKESRLFALEHVTHFFKSFLKNRRIDLGVDMFPVFHEITAKIAKMFYDTTNENFKNNAMDVLTFINGSERYARLLENVQHPANQNIYMESKRMTGAGKNRGNGGGGGFGRDNADGESG